MSLGVPQTKILKFSTGGHFEKWSKRAVSPRFFSGSISNIIPGSPLKKMIPLMEDKGGGGVHGDPSWPMDFFCGKTNPMCQCTCMCVSDCSTAFMEYLVSFYCQISFVQMVNAINRSRHSFIIGLLHALLKRLHDWKKTIIEALNRNNLPKHSRNTNFCHIPQPYLNF